MSNKNLELVSMNDDSTEMAPMINGNIRYSSCVLMPTPGVHEVGVKFPDGTIVPSPLLFPEKRGMKPWDWGCPGHIFDEVWKNTSSSLKKYALELSKNAKKTSRQLCKDYEQIADLSQTSLKKAKIYYRYL